jgi:hypothetical protein
MAINLPKLTKISYKIVFTAHGAAGIDKLMDF